MADTRILTPVEAIQLLSDNLQDETVRSEAYRDSCLLLLDAIAEDAVMTAIADRKARVDATIKAMQTTQVMSPGNETIN